MALETFHAAVRRWFDSQFPSPTVPQQGGWDAIRSGHDTLIAAPTGSGKTLAAFLHAIDELLREGLEQGLPDEVRVVYVSPLKALSADIHQNLAAPRRAIRRIAEELGLPPVKITAAVRTGDTPPSERAKMLVRPPHILVTTPESLYLLLTAQRSRAMLRTARVVIVDEIHAVIETRRGSHLALSFERLDHVAGRRLQRVGLSATQRPIDQVARFLVGTSGLDAHGAARAAVIDEGHRRALDLALEVPRSPLEAVMAAEVWEEIYDRLETLVQAHQTTLIFVNTRRLAERVAHDLSARLGEGAVTAHHGSLSKDVRVDAETRLKNGALRALVATASLELGIDIGHIDLVCQIGAPRRIATFLQRAGRAGHTVDGTPKARLFPLSRDELVECAALLRAVRDGELDTLRMPERPLDVLAQQLVAEAACEDWDEHALYELVRGAFPYRDLTVRAFEEIIEMIAQGFSTPRGRRGALVHRDAVNRRVRGRRGARLVALTSGGAIPDNADYRVVVEPAGTYVGSLNEDFAIESMAGDIFQLGNTSWRILRIESGTVRVEDARGQPPSIPFWFGEAPARSEEFSRAVAGLRDDVGRRVDDPDAAIAWLGELGIAREPAEQLVRYLADSRRVLGSLPTVHTLIAERFFDESGGMQLVVHAPFGNRVNRAWGLALRKRFCRQFNFELQAAATEDALLLSLGPQHSFPLIDVFRYLHANTVRDLLVQALLDAPVFQTRWRWNVTTALAVPRHRGGGKVPPQLQRMQAEDLLAGVFPDAAACLENIAGDREVPSHPLVSQAIADCLTEAMDVERLERILADIHSGAIRCLARDLPEPSPLSHEILNAKPYAFLDPAPLEERRTQAVYTRRALDPSDAQALGALDAAAIARVREETRSDAENADELHDALLTAGFLVHTAAGTPGETRDAWLPLMRDLMADRRAGRLRDRASEWWFAAERVAEIRAVAPGATVEPADLRAPGGIAPPDRDAALRDLLRARMEIVGPATETALSDMLGVPVGEVAIALAALETQGIVLRGRFSPGVEHREWCDRRLLARIHRYTLNRLRAEIEPVSTSDFMRFLFAWQRLESDGRVAGVEGLSAVLEQLDGYELAAGSWEPDVLASRCDDYDPLLLDTLCLTGRVSWGRLAPRMHASGSGGVSGPLRSTPVALFRREHADEWLALGRVAEGLARSSHAESVLAALERRGASFFHDLLSETGLLGTHVEQALAELAALGVVTSDSFGGLRALLVPASKRQPVDRRRRRRGSKAAFGIESAGRWSVLRQEDGMAGRGRASDEVVEEFARVLLRRYGVVFRRLLVRESLAPPWRALIYAYRAMEARGEIRGGRFVAGVTGEQFALPEAVGQLRAVRKRERDGTLIAVCGADPVNLTGIVTPGSRVAGVGGNRVLYEDGVPVASIEAGTFTLAPGCPPARAAIFQRAIVRRRITPMLRAYLGQAG